MINSKTSRSGRTQGTGNPARVPLSGFADNSSCSTPLGTGLRIAKASSSPSQFIAEPAHRQASLPALTGRGICVPLAMISAPSFAAGCRSIDLPGPTKTVYPSKPPDGNRREQKNSEPQETHRSFGVRSGMRHFWPVRFLRPTVCLSNNPVVARRFRVPQKNFQPEPVFLAEWAKKGRVCQPNRIGLFLNSAFFRIAARLPKKLSSQVPRKRSFCLARL